MLEQGVGSGEPEEENEEEKEERANLEVVIEAASPELASQSAKSLHHRRALFCERVKGNGSSSSGGGWALPSDGRRHSRVQSVAWIRRVKLSRKL